MSIAGNIVDAIFDSVDASIWIFRFLETSTFRPSFAVADGHVTNWTAECSTPGAPFGEIARFVGCLLYPNVTRSLLNGTLPVISGDTDNINLTSVGFTSPDLGLSLRSIYSTCLPTYCASVSECAATDFCDVGNLLSSSFELSAQGVGQCYNSICSRDVTPPNPDIARIGILISYLMQTAIALLSFFTLAILAFLRSREKTDSENPKQTAAPQEEAEPKGHYAIINAVVAEFHKSQCYFAMALQIATFVIIRGDFGSTTWSDKNFLLLVSADGLVPVVLTLYTIMAFGTKSWYIIVLTVITVILSSITGGLTSRRFLQPTTFVDIASGGNWPATCGGIGPVGICNFGLDPGIASGALLVAIGVLDTITIVLVLWKVFTQSTNSWSTVTKWLPVHRTSATTGATDHPAGFKKAIQFVRRHPFKVLLHSLATSALLALVGLELYEFDQIFNDGSVDLTGWGFGQIVGITIWISVFTELGYLEFNGLAKGIAWRLPSFLSITLHGTHLNFRSSTAPELKHAATDMKLANSVKHTAVAREDEDKH